MENKKFLTSETKKIALIASVIILVLSAINLFLIVFFTPNNTESLEAILEIVPFSTSLFLMLGSTVVFGVVLIRVFMDYKKQNKMVCANGIIHIAVVIAAALFFSFVIATMATKSVSSIYVYTVLFGGFAVWNVCFAVYSFKHKYKNAFFSVAYAVLDVLFALFVTIGIGALLNGSLAVISHVIVLSVINLILSIIFAVDLIVNYVVHSPDYLITEEAEKLKIIDDQKKQESKDKLNARLAMFKTDVDQMPAPTVTTPDNEIEAKLKKLDGLLAQKLITEEEYKEKRQKIIDEL